MVSSTTDRPHRCIGELLTELGTCPQLKRRWAVPQHPRQPDAEHGAYDALDEAVVNLDR